jgi:hypothetical protein
MRENRTSGSVWGALGNRCSYHDYGVYRLKLCSRMKNWMIFVLLICPDGVAILLATTVMEMIYRVSIYYNFSNSGLEFLSLGFGICLFTLMFLYRALIFLKRRKEKRSDTI